MLTRINKNSCKGWTKVSWSCLHLGFFLRHKARPGHDIFLKDKSTETVRNNDNENEFEVFNNMGIEFVTFVMI